MSIKNTLKQRIVLLGPDGAGKSSVIQGLMKGMAEEGRAVTVRHLKPFFVKPRRGPVVLINPIPHGAPPRSVLTSLAKIFIWLAEEWCAKLFQDKKGELLICDRYYHDLLVDPVRYRYGGPMWTARLVGKLIPQPLLWVLLDAPAEVLLARKQEVTRKNACASAKLTWIMSGSREATRSSTLRKHWKGWLRMRKKPSPER